MNYILALALLVISFSAAAEEYLVFEYNQNVRIVLQAEPCLVKTLTGKRAAAQRSDGQFIRGCWTAVDNGQHIRIEWENPAQPGDFSILNTRDFHPVVK
jgi:hypothetical protein